MKRRKRGRWLASFWPIAPNSNLTADGNYAVGALVCVARRRVAPRPVSSSCGKPEPGKLEDPGGDHAVLTVSGQFLSHQPW
jgi:hypothetical protein